MKAPSKQLGAARWVLVAICAATTAAVLVLEVKHQNTHKYRLEQAAAWAASATATPTPTPTPYPMPSPATAGGVGSTYSQRTETSVKLGNCQAFPDVAGHVLYWAGGYCTGPAQYIQIYDQASAPPTTTEIMPAGKCAADPAGNWAFDLRPGLYLKNGALICNSINSDPTQYSPGALDTSFGVSFAN